MCQTRLKLSGKVNECKPLLGGRRDTVPSGVVCHDGENTGRGRRVVEDKHLPDVGSPPPHPLECVSNHIHCMSNHIQANSCSDLGRVLIRNDPSVWRGVRTSPTPQKSCWRRGSCIRAWRQGLATVPCSAQPWVEDSGFGRIRSRVGFGWIRLGSWTPESEFPNPDSLFGFT